MKRYFEKISYEQFKKDIKEDQELYNEYILPKRGTKNSAGYDVFAIEGFTIEPGEIKKVPMGIKSYFQNDEMLLMLVRSSMGFKYNVRMCNQVGLFDADYYNNPDNEGHMYIALQNEGDKIFTVNKGEAFAQLIFTKYLLTDDDDASGERKGGVGSTNKGDK